MLAPERERPARRPEPGVLHVRLPVDLAEAVRLQAGAEDRSINSIVKRALRAYLAGRRR